MTKERNKSLNGRVPQTQKAPTFSESAPQDPVCGMMVNSDSPHRTTWQEEEYFFCSQHCLAKFKEAPEQYLDSGKTAPLTGSPVEEGDAAAEEYFTCPMHPEVKELGPGKCPQCGMTLELVSPGKLEVPADGALQEAPPQVLRDLVCGMAVPSDTSWHFTYQGRKYGFCSEHCLNKFREQPEEYLKSIEAAPAGVSKTETPSEAEEKQAPIAGRYLVCPIHPESRMPEPSCTLCGRPLELETVAAPTAPGAAYYTCPMDPEVRQDKPGVCPKCGMALEPAGAPPAPVTTTEWVCPMHPEVVQDTPGSCPKCGMASKSRCTSNPLPTRTTAVSTPK